MPSLTERGFWPIVRLPKVLNYSCALAIGTVPPPALASIDGKRLYLTEVGTGRLLLDEERAFSLSGS